MSKDVPPEMLKLAAIYHDSGKIFNPKYFTENQLEDEDIHKDTGLLSDKIIIDICSQLELVRSKSIAVRNLTLVSNLRNAIERYQLLG